MDHADLIHEYLNLLTFLGLSVVPSFISQGQKLYIISKRASRFRTFWPCEDYSFCFDVSKPS